MPRYRVRVELEVEAEDREEAAGVAAFMLSTSDSLMFETGQISETRVTGTEEIR